jgi:tripartite ATP-independent transporter DctM subunit
LSLTAIAIVGILALVVCIFLGMNIGIAMITVGFVGYASIKGVATAFALFRNVVFVNATNYSLVVVPLFILMGQLAFRSGLSEGLFNAANKWLSRLRGGLAYATIVACAGFAAICGSTTATAATMGVIALPEMRKNGYDDSMACGVVAAGGTLGILIPPSTGFIIYGIIAEQSIGRLFAAGIIPGIVLALCYCAAVWIQIKRNPKLAPETRDYSLKERIASLKGCLPIVVLFLAVIGGMFAGFFSAVEASAIGAMLSFFSMIINKKVTWPAIRDSLIESVKMSAMLMFIVLAAYIFGYFLAMTRAPMSLANWVGGLNVSPYVVLAAIMIVYVIMGCFMDTLAMILLTVPIFLPMIETLGFSPIWFGVLMVLVMETGMITPPVGICCYVTAGVAKVPLGVVFKGIFPMVAGILVATVIMIAFPWLSLFLPGLLYN